MDHLHKFINPTLKWYNITEMVSCQYLAHDGVNFTYNQRGLGGWGYWK